MEDIINLQNIIDVALYSVEALIIVMLAMYIFVKITPYNEFNEIRNCNKAVTFDFSGKVIAVSKIVAMSIITCKGMLAVAVWGLIGIVMLVAGFELFEYFMKDNKHIALYEGNEARGLFSACISLAIMFIVTAVIF